jgi:hypothetical protein
MPPPNPKPQPQPVPQPQPPGPGPGQATDQTKLEAALKRLAEAMEKSNQLAEQPPPAATSQRGSGGFGPLFDLLPAPLKNLVKRYQDFAGRVADLTATDAPPTNPSGAPPGKGNRPPTPPTGPNSQPVGPPGGGKNTPPVPGGGAALTGATGVAATLAGVAGGLALVGASLDAGVKTIRGFVQGMRDFTRSIGDAGRQALEFNRQYADVSPSMAMVMADYDVYQIFRKQRKGEALAPSAERLKDSQKTLEDTLEPFETWLERMGNNVEAGLNNMKTDLVRLLTFQWGSIGKYTTEEEARANSDRHREKFERFRGAGVVQPGQEFLTGHWMYSFMLAEQAEQRKREIEATLDALGKQPGAGKDEKGVPIGPNAEERKRLEGMLADILGILSEIRDGGKPTAGGQTIAEFEANLKAEVEQRRIRQRQRQDQVSRDMRKRGLYD